MAKRTTDHETYEHDVVMSWLQDREMRDHKLADARSGIGGSVIISSTIGRVQEKAYTAFPGIDRNIIHDLVRQYVDPYARIQSRIG